MRAAYSTMLSAASVQPHRDHTAGAVELLASTVPTRLQLLAADTTSSAGVAPAGDASRVMMLHSSAGLPSGSSPMQVIALLPPPLVHTLTNRSSTAEPHVSTG